MLVIPKHSLRNSSCFGCLLLALLCSSSQVQPLYEGPCLDISSGSWLDEFNDGVLCDPCCVLVPPLDPSSSVTHASRLGPATPSLSASEATALFTTRHAQPTVAAATTSAGLPSGGSGITTLGHMSVQSVVSATTSHSPTPATTSSVPITFPSSGVDPSKLSTQSPPVPSSTVSTTTTPSYANVQTPKLSATVIAVIAVVSFIGLLSLVLGTLVYIRLRARQQGHFSRQLSNAEAGILASLNQTNYSHGVVSPVTGSTPAPPRPRNPYEGIVPPDTPLLPPDSIPVRHLNVPSPGIQTAAGRR
ncbi:hypothetical protein SCLCIDRAFT_1210606 [Scleroderma citrinum Foug A]|uniref:Uncharacterized protein n=1 Tax=Scleroderma citrinum Foug A TaxID=1036808 RepID=A0A0C3A0F5_9AGAM|nr:hypothetical protein SCLCIDRAFT_1210606 [Scleroderma citrinum Foug A]